MSIWQKRGLIYKAAEHQSAWRNNSALTPTPIKLNDEVIRIYAGFRDAKGVSRIGYVDVNADNPENILSVSEHPVLDLGRNGCFDDNGVILGDVVKGPDGIYMFYVGFQLVTKAKFLAFSGLALSKDNGNTFTRVSESPILDRALGQTTIGAIHSVLYEQGRWRIWYASGDDWEYINGVPYPQYHIRYVETDDLLNIPRQGRVCVEVQNDEYRIGRPRVYLIDGQYVMYYTKGTRSGAYFPGCAFSQNGLDWTRADEKLGIDLSTEGWDAQTLCYPVLMPHKNKIYMFYNGNQMGLDGFGLAEATNPK